jgi:alpha-ribazole phosphatase
MIRVIRHGRVDANGRCYGRTDLPTIESAEHCARKVLNEDVPQEVWASPLMRCSETAVWLAQAWSVPLRVDERLQEASFGEWEGRSWDEIQIRDGKRLSAWMDAWQTTAPPGGESLAELEARVKSVWAEIPSGALVVSHSGVIRALRVVLEGQTWEQAIKGEIPHLVPRLFPTLRKPKQPSSP